MSNGDSFCFFNAFQGWLEPQLQITRRKSMKTFRKHRTFHKNFPFIRNATCFICDQCFHLQAGALLSCAFEKQVWVSCLKLRFGLMRQKAWNKQQSFEPTIQKFSITTTTTGPFFSDRNFSRILSETDNYKKKLFFLRKKIFFWGVVIGSFFRLKVGPGIF